MNEYSSNPGSDDEELVPRVLVERLLAPPDPDGGPAVGPPRLFPGRLPDGLPPELPMPDGVVLLGGSTQDLGRGRWTTEIVLDAEQPAERFREDYRRRLLAGGWQEDEDWSGPGRHGFVPPGLPGLFVRAAHRSPRLRRRLRGRVPGLPNLFPDLLRLGEDGPGLAVTAADRHDAPTDVRLRILYGRRGPRGRRDPAWDAIPSLVPPPGARGRREDAGTGILHPPRDARGLPGGSGGRWESDGAYSHATLETGLDLEALASHYTAQLRTVDWTLTGEGQSGPQAWSTWRFADAQGRPWTGAFSALRLLGPPARYLLQVHARRTLESR